MNSVKLYSNGTAVISREFTFQDQQPQRIPSRCKTDLDDVISSLSMYGDARDHGPSDLHAHLNARGTL